MHLPIEFVGAVIDRPYIFCGKTGSGSPEYVYRFC